jgi:hypothetical protein
LLAKEAEYKAYFDENFKGIQDGIKVLAPV